MNRERPAFILGVDPGPSTGIAVLRLDARRPEDLADAFQCSIGAAPWLLARICEHMIAGAPAAGQVEGFAPGHGAGAVLRAGRVTRDQVQAMQETAARYGIPMCSRYKAAIKSWATDERLAAAGLLGLTAGGVHSRDAMRHALFCACHDHNYPDPLIRRKGIS